MVVAFDSQAWVRIVEEILLGHSARVFDAVAKLEGEGRDVITWQIAHGFRYARAHKAGSRRIPPRGDVHYAPRRGTRLAEGHAQQEEVDTGMEVKPERR